MIHIQKYEQWIVWFIGTKKSLKNDEEYKKEDSLTGDEDMFTWYEVSLDEEMAKQDDLAHLEWEGYVADKVWQVSSMFNGVFQIYKFIIFS